MAKQTDTSAAAGKNAANEVQAGTAAASLPRIKVGLKCPTPLEHRELVIEAASEAEAQRIFMAANGISGSSCEWSFQQTDEPATWPPKPDGN